MRINPVGGSGEGFIDVPSRSFGVCGGVNTKTGCRVHTRANATRTFTRITQLL